MTRPGRPADTTGWPYRRRRAALESVFAARQLSAPWTLCPSTAEADVVREWLTWVDGRDGGGGLQEAGRCLPALGEGLAEIQGPRDERGDRRHSHRPSGHSPHAAARQVRRPRPPSVRRAAPPPSPRRQVRRSLACSLRDGAVIRGQAGRSASGGAAGKRWTSRWWNPSW